MRERVRLLGRRLRDGGEQGLYTERAVQSHKGKSGKPETFGQAGWRGQETGHNSGGKAETFGRAGGTVGRPATTVAEDCGASLF